MNIPQEELDKLNETSFEVGTNENEEEENESLEENIEEENEETVIEKENEEEVSVSTDEDTVADKARVPYSRFETVNERAIRAEERLKIIEEQNAEKQKIAQELEVPEKWLELYGDNEIAREAWVLDQEIKRQAQQEITESVKAQVIEDLKREETEAKQNLAYIENNIREFEKTLGRKLTEEEESNILDIQEEFTPKDSNGNFIAPLLSTDKAFEVYSLRQKGAKAEKSQTRKRLVSLTGASSDGESSSTQAFENYKPGDSGLWRNKLNN